MKPSIYYIKLTIFILLNTIILLSCSRQDIKPPDNPEERGILLELDSAKFPVVKKDTVVKSVYDILYQLDGLQFYIQAYDNLVLQSYGQGKNLLVEPIAPDDDSQLFYFKFSPLSSDNPYMLYSVKENTAIGVGAYAKSPDQYFPFTQRSGRPSSFGFSWIPVLNSERTAYYLDSRDVSGTVMIDGKPKPFNYSIRAEYGRLFMGKRDFIQYLNFVFVPNEEFILESIQLDTTGGRITNSRITRIDYGLRINNWSTEFRENVLLRDTLKSEFSIQETFNGISFKKNKNVELETDLPRVSSSAGVNSFGKKEKIKMNYGPKPYRTVVTTYPMEIVIPAYSWFSYDLWIVQHAVELKYKAVYRGVKSGKSINVSGVYSGYDFSSPYLEVSTRPNKTN
ncbi:hypothetical protein HMPREF0765_1067 [Sphingobacterium spiritivorum ATCC 33300]|uniref:Uncharacterized protein n=1 Tax=Sphingobacterium spiritivorum ATCC 33300 TaxID=525372 RepID=C2FUR1_SPHSI|nr:hypothetical protein [Sphingobacterium spiritivorum]EEI93265.1 hypothetical protein HMPREF0765_1067 [Sphingobacterium spiritivorum ATCC 33300]QQS95967.1 hypothetical protein I6J03_21775 [Sphingobacterium spiritivorum]